MPDCFQQLSKDQLRSLRLIELSSVRRRFILFRNDKQNNAFLLSHPPPKKHKINMDCVAKLRPHLFFRDYRYGKKIEKWFKEQLETRKKELKREQEERYHYVRVYTRTL